MDQLSGKRAFVTGASSGIGQAIAIGMAREGANVAVHGRSLEALADSVQGIEASGAQAVPVIADFSDEANVKPICEQALEGLGGIDIVVNNAGMDLGGYTVIDTDEADWDRLYQVNLKTYFLISKYTAPAMIGQKTGGRYINIGSIGGKIAQAGLAHYNSAKMAVTGFGRSFAAEMGEHGITVNTICPGFTETKLNLIIFNDMAKESGRPYDEIHDEEMLGNMLHMLILPDDIANLAVFLASDKARAITAQDINVCAGLCLW
jgi:NAD(P)-dependent dehydrogenase (short-subunit alcohol dehydrogenase family)